MDELQTARREFAEWLRENKRIRSDAVVKAFATVPRETFLGPPPWKIWDPIVSPIMTPTTIPYELHHDPKKLYRDVLVALDAERGINNGQPSLWAIVYDRIDARSGERIVHIGCGVGYYTAILAELVGASGSVIGLDIDQDLLARAGTALSGRANVEIKECNGASYNEGPADIIVVNAGITHPLDVWLDALKPGGRLMVPLTFDGYRTEAGYGGFFLIVRKMESFTARFICPTGILHFTGARNAEASKRLTSAWRKDESWLPRISSLRRDKHDEDGTCWLHGVGYCLSARAPGTIH
jgi:protein-L-isoaspartate(D-aspartate) O-methyltransferase